MRLSRLLLPSILVLVALAVPSWAAEPSSPPAAACLVTPATQATDEAPVLPQAELAPLFATIYLCGTCSGACSGLMSGAPCGEEGGCYIGINVSTHQPMQCQPPDSGNRCLCL